MTKPTMPKFRSKRDRREHSRESLVREVEKRRRRVAERGSRRRGRKDKAAIEERQTLKTVALKEKEGRTG